MPLGHSRRVYGAPTIVSGSPNRISMPVSPIFRRGGFGHVVPVHPACGKARHDALEIMAGARRHARLPPREVLHARPGTAVAREARPDRLTSGPALVSAAILKSRRPS